MTRRQFGDSFVVADSMAIFVRPWVYFACGMLLAACGGGGGGGGGGTATPTTTASTPPPSLTFTSSTGSIAPGESVTLSWQSSNTDSCQASGDWSGDKPTSGNESFGPLQTSQTFSLSCSGSGGGTLREVTVNVQQNAGISLSFSSDQYVVLINGQVQLSWTATNADSCVASDDWTGDQALSGTFTTPPLTQTSSFKLTCFAQAESAETLLTVQVTDPTIRWQAPTENVDGTPLTTLASFNVYWGDSSRNYTGSTNVAASDLEWEIPFGSGTYYLAVTAVDTDTSESDYSNEIRKVIP